MFSKLIEKYNRIALPAKASIWFVICSIIQKGIALMEPRYNASRTGSIPKPVLCAV